MVPPNTDPISLVGIGDVPYPVATVAFTGKAHGARRSVNWLPLDISGSYGWLHHGLTALTVLSPEPPDFALARLVPAVAALRTGLSVSESHPRA